MEGEKRPKSNAEAQHDWREREKARIGEKKFREKHAKRMIELRAKHAKIETEEEKKRKKILNSVRNKKWRAQKKAKKLASQQKAGQQQEGQELEQELEEQVQPQPVEPSEPVPGPSHRTSPHLDKQSMNDRINDVMDIALESNNLPTHFHQDNTTYETHQEDNEGKVRYIEIKPLLCNDESQLLSHSPQIKLENNDEDIETITNHVADPGLQSTAVKCEDNELDFPSLPTVFEDKKSDFHTIVTKLESSDLQTDTTDATVISEHNNYEIDSLIPRSVRLIFDIESSQSKFTQFSPPEDKSYGVQESKKKDRMDHIHKRSLIQTKEITAAIGKESHLIHEDAADRDESDSSCNLNDMRASVSYLGPHIATDMGNQSERLPNIQSNEDRLTRIKTIEKPLCCDFCQKRFSHKGHLKSHLAMHTDDRPYLCYLCNKSFKRQNSLKYHILTHTDEKRFACDLCDKRYKGPNGLKYHKLQHTDEKHFVCDICNKSFSGQSTLKSHLHTHTEQSPYACKECGKSFRCKTELKYHSYIHTGEKPYPCDICGKQFKRPSEVTTHLRSHTGETPFACNICEKEFRYRAGLKKHLTTHTA